MDLNIKSEILKLKKERDAVIVAHNYQIDEVQEIADIVGDSFALSQYCAKSEAKTIVFCGVHFMAESAKILSPEKTVLLPEIDAGCPMADMVTAEALKKEKLKYPNAKVVCYINSSAEVKAECDICCTSSNAERIVASISEKEILFVPDQNLGHFISKKFPEKIFRFWKGYCITHHRVNKEDVNNVRKTHPDALVLVHPECKPEVVELADFVGSTSQIIEYATKNSHKQFVIGTEMGILYKLKEKNPDKRFYLLSQGMVCPNMKKTTLNSVYNSLKHNRYEINLDKNIIDKARKSLEEMLKHG